MLVRSVRRALVAAALTVASVGVIGTAGATPAGATWDECPNGYYCFFTGTEGTGAHWKYNAGDLDISGQGVVARSAINRRDGVRGCGFRQRNRVDVVVGTGPRIRHTFQLTAIRSVAFVGASGSCYDIQNP